MFFYRESDNRYIVLPKVCWRLNIRHDSMLLYRYIVQVNIKDKYLIDSTILAEESGSDINPIQVHVDHDRHRILQNSIYSHNL